MKTFRIMFHGTNYDILADNGKAGGFYVTVNVMENDPDRACSVAYEKLIHSEKYMTYFPPDKHPDGVLSIEEICELAEVDPEAPEISGFIFYGMKD